MLRKKGKFSLLDLVPVFDARHCTLLRVPIIPIMYTGLC